MVKQLNSRTILGYRLQDFIAVCVFVTTCGGTIWTLSANVSDNSARIEATDKRVSTLENNIEVNRKVKNIVN
jgi:hypothetical protein